MRFDGLLSNHIIYPGFCIIVFGLYFLLVGIFYLRETEDEWSSICVPIYFTILLVLIAIVVRILFRIFKNSKFFEYSVSDYKENQPKIEKYDKWNLLVGYYGLAIISTIPQFIVWWVEYDGFVSHFEF